MDITYIVSSYKCLSTNLQFQIQSVRVLSTFSSYFSCLHQRSHSKEHVAFHAAKFSLGARGGGHGVVDHGLSGGALDLCRALGFTKGIEGWCFEMESCEMEFDLFFASGGGTNAVGLEVGWNGIQCWEDFAGLCFRC